MPRRLAAILLWLGGSVLALREIQLTVPEAVGLGASATLGCRWYLDTGETLYTVKWYHGAQEFFRYVPKEHPNTRVFSQTGISVDVSRSGGQQVVLRGATRSLTGRYRCEVSADAPYFHTVYKSALLRVVELPTEGPRVHAPKTWYSVGDMLRANCSSAPADPPATLTWLLNGQEVKGLDIPSLDTTTHVPRKKAEITDASLEDANRIIFSPWDAIPGYEESATDNIIDIIPGNIGEDLRRKNKTEPTGVTPPLAEILVVNKLNVSAEEEKSNKSSSFSQLAMRVQSVHFHKGRLNLTCVARVLSAWSASGILLLDEERPQIAPVMGSRDSNSGTLINGTSSTDSINSTNSANNSSNETGINSANRAYNTSRNNDITSAISTNNTSKASSTNSANTTSKAYNTNTVNVSSISNNSSKASRINSYNNRSKRSDNTSRANSSHSANMTNTINGCNGTNITISANCTISASNTSDRILVLIIDTSTNNTNAGTITFSVNSTTIAELTNDSSINSTNSANNTNN